MKINFAKFLFLIIFLLFAYNSCQYFNLMSYKEWMETTGNDKVDIYCAGYYEDGMGNYYACYWKNSKLYILPGASDSYANSIYVYNNDVYIAGNFTSGAQHACFWKNGEGPYPLDEAGQVSSGAYSIYIVNGDIYISGYLWFTTNRACYWQNNKVTILENNGTSQALEIKVIKKHETAKEIIYTSGYSQTGPQVACYWINNKLYNLPHLNDGWVNSIYIYNDKVYAAGNYTQVGGNNACYWIDQNGPYDYGLLDSQAHSIFVEKDCVHIVGCRDVPSLIVYYFKNNTYDQLANTGIQSEAKSIYFFDDTYYIAGFDQIGISMAPAIWRSDNNFELERMEYIVGYNYTVESIVITRRR